VHSKKENHKQSLQDSLSENDKKRLIDFYALLLEWQMEDQNKKDKKSNLVLQDPFNQRIN
jgi:hypothetical protein